MLNNLAPNLWVAEVPWKMLGIEYGARMTVVRLASGALVIISPIRLTKELLTAVSGLGPVTFLVAPSSFHHLFMADWVKAFPDATVLLVPQLVKKRPDLQPAVVMDEALRPSWGPDLRLLYVPGGKMYSEAVFLHVPSKTLILTDLCFNLQAVEGIFGKVMLTLYGIYKKFGPSKAVAIFMGDRARLRRHVDQIATWDFERVIVAHGAILENTDPKTVRQAFDAIL